MAAKESTHLPHSRQPAILPFRPQLEALTTSWRAHGPAPLVGRADLGWHGTHQHPRASARPSGARRN